MFSEDLGVTDKVLLKIPNMGTFRLFSICRRQTTP